MIRKGWLLRNIIGLFLGCILLGTVAFAAGDKPAQAGSKVLSGGQRDLLWPVPGQYNISSCFLDGRSHKGLDIAAPKGSKIVASYAGKVVEVNTSCDHNYGKKYNCCKSYGNYLILDHDYILENGEYITLYTLYSHMTKVSVSLGDRVKAGEKIGTVGSTGYSTGPHLHYQVMYDTYYPYKEKSVDPFINNLLELPEDLHTTFGGCCEDYVDYVKELYPRCLHKNVDAEGICNDCGYAFDWKETQDSSVMGSYKVVSETTIATTPYSSALSETTLAAGEKVTVKALVTNGLGEKWYQLENGYVPKAALEFVNYLDSKIQGNISSLEEGQILAQESHPLIGTVTSRYPLTKITGYVDGDQYATWTGWDTDVNLRDTSLNSKLRFSNMEPGKHTITIIAEDSTGREEKTVFSCTFSIEQPEVFYKVTFRWLEESETVEILEGETLSELPEPEKEGYLFLGWFTAEDGGKAWKKTSVVTEDVTLYAQWELIPVEETVPETEPTIPETEPTIPETEPTIPETEPTIPESQTTIPETTVPETQATTPETVPESQPEEPNSPVIWIVVAVVILGCGAVGAWLWLKKKQTPETIPEAAAEESESEEPAV